MITNNDIKMDIISLLSNINDIEALKRIYENVEAEEKSSISSKNVKKLDLQAATTEILKNKSYKEILQEQDYQPISYEAFRTLADEIEWEHSLEELLEALD